MRRLLIRPGAIGDFLVSLPALEALGSEHTEAWVSGPVAPLVRFADRVRSISSTGLDLLEIHGPERCRTLVGELRRFDAIVSWYGTKRPEFRLVVEALGLPFVFLPALPEDGRQHATDYYLEQVRALARRPLHTAPHIACPPVGRRYAVIHPFSGSPRKNWLFERFGEVARWLSARMPVEWCAGPDEKLDEARRFEDLYALACWLRGARLYLGNDSGISHLAAAVGTPTLVLFGPTNPAVWGPRGDHVRILSAPGGAMENLDVGPVLEQLKAWLVV